MPDTQGSRLRRAAFPPPAEAGGPHAATSLEQVAGGFVVNYANGRRGSSLQDGTRTPQPVGEADARALFAAIKKEKLKEYAEGEPGGAPMAAAVQPEAEWAAQLLNPWPEADIEQLLADDAYGAQEKHDGENRPAGVTAELVPFGVNRDGARVGRFVLASEAVGSGLIVHDLLWLKRHDYRRSPKPMQI